MTTCLGKSRSFGLLCVPFVNCCQFLYLVISLLFWGQDMGSDCVSSWSLLIFLLHMNSLISHKVFVVLHPLQYYNCLVTYSRMMGKSKSSKIVLRVEIFPHFQEYFHHIKTIIWICFFCCFFLLFFEAFLPSQQYCRHVKTLPLNLCDFYPTRDNAKFKLPAALPQRQSGKPPTLQSRYISGRGWI